jgi:hypothetical protein
LQQQLAERLAIFCVAVPACKYQSIKPDGATARHPNEGSFDQYECGLDGIAFRKSKRDAFMEREPLEATVWLHQSWAR